MRLLTRLAQHRYPRNARELLKEAINHEWGWKYWPYSHELMDLIKVCRHPDGRLRPKVYDLYLYTKEWSDYVANAQTAMEQDAQARWGTRYLTDATVLATKEQQEEYEQSENFRDALANTTDWFRKHEAEYEDLCDAAIHPRVAPQGYIAVCNGLHMVPLRPVERSTALPTPRDSRIMLSAQPLPFPAREARGGIVGAAAQGVRRVRRMTGTMRNLVRRMTGRGEVER